MAKRVGLLMAVALLASGMAAGPASAQDAQAVLQAAAETMGVDDMMSIRYSGSGWVGAAGQSFAPAEDWPRFELAEYERTIDFETESSTEEMVIRQGNYPARGGGGAPIVGDRIRNWMVRGEFAWNGEIDRVVPRPQDAERRRLEIARAICSPVSGCGTSSVRPSRISTDSGERRGTARVARRRPATGSMNSMTSSYPVVSS